MYCEFYQLRERPFNVTADPKFLYLNNRYREALASLQYGITQRKGFITLIGEAGTGKTTLLKKLLDELDEHTRTVFIFNTNVTFDEILEYIFAEFDLPTHNGKRLYMLQRLNAFLLEELQQGRNVALLIDEAQDLDQVALEDLRLLSNLETAKEKILQIVLSGQPELGQKLGSPGLRQLRQRVAINCRLLPLTREEISEYIQARLAAAGGSDPKLFTRDAEDRIYEISMGIPRLVNVVCDNSLVIGYALGKRRIGAEVVTEAAADLLTMEPPPEVGESIDVAAPNVSPLPRPRRWSQLGVIAVVLVAIVVGLLSVGRSLLPRDTANGVAGGVKGSPLEVIQPGSRAEPDALGRDNRPWRPVPQAPAAVRDEPVAPAPFGATSERVPPQQPVQDHAAARPAAEQPVPPDNAHEATAGTVAAAGANDPPRVPEGLPHRVPAGDSVRVPAGDPVNVPAGDPVGGNAPAPPSSQSSLGARPATGGNDSASGATAPLPPAAAGTTERVAVAPQPETAAGAQPKAPASAAAPGDAPAQLAAVPPRVPESAEWVAPAPAANNDHTLALALQRYQPVTVNAGQSISELAVRKYGQASHTILDMVKLANPRLRNVDIVSVGQTLQLPELDEGLVVLREGESQYALLLLSSPAWQRVKNLEVVLRQRGLHAQVQETDFGPGRTIYRLLISGMASREAALATGKKVQRLFREDDKIAALAR